MRKTRKSGRVKDWVCNISTHHSWRFRFWQQYCWTYTENVPNDATLRVFFHTIFMHQSIPAAPSTPPGYCGAFAHLVSPGGGAFANFVLPRGRAFANPGPFLSFWHTRSFLSENNYTEDFTGKESRLAHLSRTGKLKRFVKACSWFCAWISSLLIEPELHSEIGSYRRESTFFGYWIKFLLRFMIWKTSFHIYKTIHNI